MVICPGPLKLEDVALLSIDTSTKKMFSELQQLLVVTAREKVCIFWLQAVVDDGQQSRNFLLVVGRDGGKLKVSQV